MKRIPTLLFLKIFLLAIASCTTETKPEAEKFSFAFITDIHLQKEDQAPEGFRKAIADINALQPDFVLTGGDLIMDALEEPYESADSLYDMYVEEVKGFNMPVYNTIGNHELFGIYEVSGVSPDHPEYRYGMYEKRIGETYYSFDHKGWHFIVLNVIQDTEDREYIGMVDEVQMEWLKADLLEVDPKTPIVISTHIPFITVFTQILYGEYAPDYHGLVVENARDVLDLFAAHNLKLVLQGHLHYLEYIELYGISFITSGAISGHWWEGPNRDIEEGYLMVYVEGDDFCWEYVDYEWDAEKASQP